MSNKAVDSPEALTLCAGSALPKSCRAKVCFGLICMVCPKGAQAMYVKHDCSSLTCIEDFGCL